MINKETFSNLNIHAKNILKENNCYSLSNNYMDTISSNEMYNFIINSNLDSYSAIK